MLVVRAVGRSGAGRNARSEERREEKRREEKRREEKGREVMRGWTISTVRRLPATGIPMRGSRETKRYDL